MRSYGLNVDTNPTNFLAAHRVMHKWFEYYEDTCVQCGGVLGLLLLSHLLCMKEIFQSVFNSSIAEWPFCPFDCSLISITFYCKIETSREHDLSLKRDTTEQP